MIDIYEVVRKLVGNIRPVGESHTDTDRFNNLLELTDLVDKLLSDIDAVAYDYRNNHQHSMKKAAKFAKEFLDKIGIEE